MVGSEFLDYISKFQVATYVGVEDFADKFNFLITVMILLLCTTVVTVKQYMMKPISCYMATDIGGKNLLDYVENYCWVQGTIPIAYAGHMPETDEAWEQLEKQKLLYYQWVPFVLGLQCIMFYIPRVIWQMICYNRTGTDIQHLVLSANQAVHATDDQRTKLVQHVARTLEQMLFQNQRARALSRNRYIELQTSRSAQRATVTAQPSLEQGYATDLKNTSCADKPYGDLSRSHNEFDGFTESKSQNSLIGLCCHRLWRAMCCVPLDHHRGTFLSLAYLLMKVLYLVNSIGQLFLMQRFLGLDPTTNLFGVVLLHNILNGQDWQATLVFPRVAYCYAPIRHLGTTTNVAVAQCVLPVNMLNEKIYIFLWWWVLLVALLTALSLIRWCMRMASRVKGTDFVKKYLTLSDIETPINDRYVMEFCKRFLRRDGVFLLRMIAQNAGDLIASEILRTLWQRYVESDRIQKYQLCRNLKEEDFSFQTNVESNGAEATAPPAEVIFTVRDEITHSQKSIAGATYPSIASRTLLPNGDLPRQLILGSNSQLDHKLGSYV